jgi:hypothetical protein
MAGVEEAADMKGLEALEALEEVPVALEEALVALGEALGDNLR